jgi:hypothetical protein
VDLSQAFDPQFCRYDKFSRALLAAYLQVIANFMDRVDLLYATQQDIDDTSEKCDWLEHVLETALSLPFPEVVKYHLKAPLDPVYRIAGIDQLYKILITCWTRYVAMITDKKEVRADRNVGTARIDILLRLTSLQYLDEYVTTGPNAVFEIRLKYELADHYWPYFLTELVKYKKSVDFEVFRLCSPSTSFTYD